MWVSAYLRQRVNALESLIFLGVFFSLVKFFSFLSDGRLFNWPSRLVIENFVPSTIALSVFFSMNLAIIYAASIQLWSSNRYSEKLLAATKNTADFSESYAALGLGIYMFETILSLSAEGYQSLPVRLSTFFFILAGFFPVFVLSNLVEMEFEPVKGGLTRIKAFGAMMMFVVVFLLLLVFGVHPEDQCNNNESFETISTAARFFLC